MKTFPSQNWKWNFPLNLPLRPSVGCSAGHDFLKGQVVSLPCSYEDTFFSIAPHNILGILITAKVFVILQVCWTWLTEFSDIFFTTAIYIICPYMYVGWYRIISSFLRITEHVCKPYIRIMYIWKIHRIGSNKWFNLQ